MGTPFLRASIRVFSNSTETSPVSTKLAESWISLTLSAVILEIFSSVIGEHEYEPKKKTGNSNIAELRALLLLEHRIKETIISDII